jgi:hypothetical protein
MPLDGTNFVELDTDITKVLIKARDYLVEHGWCQGAMENRSGQVCIFGAVYIVGEFNSSVDPTFSRVMFALKNITKDSAQRWNDEPGRTQEEVVSLFDQAIAISRK